MTIFLLGTMFGAIIGVMAMAFVARRKFSEAQADASKDQS